MSRNSKVGNFLVANTDANAIKVNSVVSDSFNIAYNNRKEFCDEKVLNLKKNNTDKLEQKQPPRLNIENTDLKQAQNDVQMETIETTDLKQVAYQSDAQEKAFGDTDGEDQKECGDMKVLNVSRDTIENTDLKQAVHQSDAQRKALEDTDSIDHKEIGDVKVENVKSDSIESTDLKQAFHQRDANKEAVEDMDDEEEDFNDLDRLSPESDTESRNITTGASTII